MTGQVEDSRAELERQLAERTRELGEARARESESLEQQTATGDILRVISSSPTDLQPVFDCILENATRLCGAHLATLGLFDGEKFEHMAQRGGSDEFVRDLFRGPFVPTEGSNLRRMLEDGRPVHVPDRQAQRIPSGSPAFLRNHGARTLLGVPLLKDGRAIGTIVIYRPEVRPFTQKQIDLVSTFADQAVIAIENVRLFNATKEALEQQTATAEILRVISSSPTDIQPVLEAVAESAARLCGANDVVIRLVEGDSHRGVAHHGPIPVAPVRPVKPEGMVGYAILTAATVHVPDIEEPSARLKFPEVGRAGNRSFLAAPLVREGMAIGAIIMRRLEVHPFTDNQIKLLETFAAQAVIAIENVRLFNELQTRNKDLAQTLEQQTATSEILGAIAKSPTDVTPVLETIMKNAVRLCGSPIAAVFPFDGTLVHLAATHNWPQDTLAELTRRYPGPPNAAQLSGRTILSQSVVRVPDALADPNHRAAAVKGNWRRMLGVPLMRDGNPIGALAVAWPDPGETPEREVELLKTFADQAVIAIENVRLFRELQARNAEVTESLEQQTATAEILKIISGSRMDIQPVFEAILDNALRLCDAHLAAVGLYDSHGYRRVAHRGDRPQFKSWLSRDPYHPSPRTGLGRMIAERRPVHIEDLKAEQPYRDGDPGRVATVDLGGARTFLAVPLLKEDRLIGGIVIHRPEVRPFTSKQIDLLATFAAQAVIAIENVRLFNEIQEKSRELEVANRHKSEFLAGMSHELRTPLNAILGFSEVLAERMFGEINEKQAEYLEDIRSSGTHLLSLINDILDLSKIEAGRMELELSGFDVAAALENSLTLVRERATRHGIALDLRCDPAIGCWTADERKFKQIMLNLLSNAVKFTPPGGRITVEAHRRGDVLAIAVSDTGCGISAEDQALVFEEFRQVGADNGKKAEGTGLGLALTRKFVELHGGSIAVRSDPSQGATFSFTLPHRALS